MSLRCVGYSMKTRKKAQPRLLIKKELCTQQNSFFFHGYRWHYYYLYTGQPVSLSLYLSRTAWFLTIVNSSRLFLALLFFSVLIQANSPPLLSQPTGAILTDIHCMYVYANNNIWFLHIYEKYRLF